MREHDFGIDDYEPLGSTEEFIGDNQGLDYLGNGFTGA